MATGRGESPSSQQRGPGWAQLFLETRRRGWGPPTRPRALAQTCRAGSQSFPFTLWGLPPPKRGICAPFPKIKRPPLSYGVIKKLVESILPSLGTPPKFHNQDHWSLSADLEREFEARFCSPSPRQESLASPRDIHTFFLTSGASGLQNLQNVHPDEAGST